MKRILIEAGFNPVFLLVVKLSSMSFKSQLFILMLKNKLLFFINKIIESICGGCNNLYLIHMSYSNTHNEFETEYK